MIIGTHTILFSADADADRAFLRDVLHFSHVDAGGGWLLFALPPSELAVHPGTSPSHQMYFMSNDLDQDIADLANKGVTCGPTSEERWGTLTSIPLPGGGSVGLYEPRHLLAHDA